MGIGNSSGPGERGWSSEDDPLALGRAVVRQRDPSLMSGQRHTVKLRTDDTAALAARILDVYVVTGGFRRWKWCLCRRRNTPHYVHRPPQTCSSAAIFQGGSSRFVRTY